MAKKKDLIDPVVEDIIAPAPVEIKADPIPEPVPAPVVEKIPGYILCNDDIKNAFIKSDKINIMDEYGKVILSEPIHDGVVIVIEPYKKDLLLSKGFKEIK